MRIRALRGLVQNTCSIVRWSPMGPLGLPTRPDEPPRYRGPQDMVVANDEQNRRRYSLTNFDDGGSFASGRSFVTGFDSIG